MPFLGIVVRRRIGWFFPALLLAVAVFPIPGRAAEPISEAYRGDIVTLLEMTGAEKIGLQMGAAVSSQMIDFLRSQNPEIPQGAVDAIKDEVARVLEEAFPDLLSELIPVYARHLSQEEVKGLIAFYETPLGKKSIQVMPLVMGESMVAGQKWGQGLTPKLGPRLEERLRKEGFGDQL